MRLHVVLAFEFEHLYDTYLIFLQFILLHWKRHNFCLTQRRDLIFGHRHERDKTLYTLNISVISEVKGQIWWRHLRLLLILTTVNYFETLLFRKPHGQFSLFLYRITAIILLNLLRFELYIFYVEAFKCRKFRPKFVIRKHSSCIKLHHDLFYSNH